MLGRRIDLIGLGAGIAIAMAAAVTLAACAVLGPSELMARADAELKQGRYAAARSSYKLYLKEYSGDTRASEAAFKIGRARFEQGQWLLALEEFGDVIEAYPEADAVWDSLYFGGLAYAKLGRCVDASAWLGKLSEAVALGVPGALRYGTKAETELALVNDDMSGAHHFCTVHTGSA